jgi:hypothetical protein
MKTTLQDVFQENYDDFAEVHPQSFQQQKVAAAIINCRTSFYGGRVEQCPDCHHTKIVYNSCRNRHCPQCQTIPKERWIDARLNDLLPIPYFHLVFTLPQELHPLVMHNQRTLYGMLFQAVSQTLSELLADRKYLGVQAGFMAILHTWGQTLTFHPHLHVVLPNGGLTPHGTFKVGSKQFVLPIKVLSRLFRGKFMALLRKAYDKNELTLSGAIASLQYRQVFANLRNQLYQSDWFVYAKQPFSGPEAVVHYLGRYTHRTAISNSRIVQLTEEQVTFRWHDYRDNQEKLLTLEATEFIRRMMLHVLPHGFMRIRYYGLLANCNRKTKLKRCRRMLGCTQSKARYAELTAVELITELLGQDPTLCPRCRRSHMITVYSLPRPNAPPRVA